MVEVTVDVGVFKELVVVATNVDVVTVADPAMGVVDVSWLKTHFVGNVRKFKSWRSFPAVSTNWNLDSWPDGLSKRARPMVVVDPPQMLSRPGTS